MIRPRAARNAPLLLVATCLAAVLATSGCTSAGSPARVASIAPAPRLSHASAAASTASTASDSRRPVLRVDDSAARVSALYDAWNHCLYAHGATKPSSGLGAAAPSGQQFATNVPPAAQRSCLHLEPVTPPALNAGTNPHFHEQSLTYVSCMRRRGLFVELTDSDTTSWTYAPRHAVPADADRISASCLSSSFSGS